MLRIVIILGLVKGGALVLLQGSVYIVIILGLVKGGALVLLQGSVHFADIHVFSDMEQITYMYATQN